METLHHIEVLPCYYKPKLDFLETQKAIKLVKDTFERELAARLNLLRVSAPRFLLSGTGLQDDLGGTQTPVRFKPRFSDTHLEIVHSLAKWKRYALWRYGFKTGSGLYTGMDAIRKDEEISPIHSIYVDQWDWERVISAHERNLEFLKGIVRRIYNALLETEARVAAEFSAIAPRLPKGVRFIHSEELERLFPGLTPKQREDEAARKWGAVFIIGIGYPLASGKPHDLRAADYDDWSSPTIDGKHGLNGDLIVWHHERGRALELSSMGIRVDSEAMLRQLRMAGLEERQFLDFHRLVIEGRLPLSIGGGIGQSRLCMVLLHKAHIGEVQSSIWPVEVVNVFEERGIALL